MLTWFRQHRARRMAPLIAEQRALHALAWDSPRIREWQLVRFNEQWRQIAQTVPYYARLTRERKLPAEFSSWEQFQSMMPVMDRKTVREHVAELSDRTRATEYTRTTGGSTCEPVYLPGWKAEQAIHSGDMWLARSWFGVSPADRLFLIWGHSHAMGRGLAGRLNAWQRSVKDTLLGYRRHSGYVINDTALRAAAERFLAWRPAYLMSYSVALDRFARVNADRRADFHRLKLKVALATAEALPRDDSRDIISNVLGCPVAMEYGAVETGLIAHERPGGGYGVFWPHNFVEAQPCAGLPGTQEILVTSLFPRCFALIRYQLGDLVALDPAGAPVAEAFASVAGRNTDYVVAPDGGEIHAVSLSHAMNHCRLIQSLQVVQRNGGPLEVHYLASKELPPAEEEEIRRRLNLVHPALRQIRLTRVSRLEQTIAGKIRRVVRD